jgi:hypothetical protein
MFESIHHPKKTTTMAKPNAGTSGMAIVINSCPPPGTSLQWVGLGRIQRILFNYLKRLKRIHCVMASILFKFFLHPNSIALKTIKYRSHQLQVLSYPSSAAPAWI